MSSNVFQSPILWQPEDYLLFQKCGEISISPDIQNIGYNCLFCTGICLQSDIFLQHLQQHHREDVYKLYENQNAKMPTTSDGDGYFFNEMVVNLSDLNFKANEQLNNVLTLNQINKETKEADNCIILNSLDPMQMLNVTADDLNLVYDLQTNDLLTINTPTSATTNAHNELELENLITQNPLENLNNTTIRASDTSLAISVTKTMADCFKCLTVADNNDCEIGDGEDSGIMLVQSPCQSSDCGGFSDCMSFSEDNSNKVCMYAYNTCIWYYVSQIL